MVRSSLRQLLRTPWKTLLFFLLMAACALLLVFGSVMLAETNQRIAEVDSSFTTIGMVEQDAYITNKQEATYDHCMGNILGRTDVYADKISIDALDFEGAQYVHKPVSRPYYAAYLPSLAARPSTEYEPENYIQFQALEDMTELGQPTPILIEKVLNAEPPETQVTTFVDPSTARTLAEGEIFYFCEHQFVCNEALPLEKGKSYMANVWYYACGAHPEMEVVLYSGPRMNQYDRDGSRREPIVKYAGNCRLDEVTEGYWEEGGRGQDWLNQLDFKEKCSRLFLVTPTDSLQLIPAFQYQQAYVEQGREISDEEFRSGALVCMVSEKLASLNNLQIGDKISLPMTYAMYNASGDSLSEEACSVLSCMNAQGELYQPFWEAEYEIVGTYTANTGSTIEEGKFPQCFIVPQKSVQASDSENITVFEYLNPWTCTFQIPNGTIAEFDAALRENVPEMDSLTVTYNDNGYTDIMATLQSTRTTAVLLFAVGLAASIAVVILLLYFFVVKQKKRTAIEQSLGMTRAQCRTSILAGVMVLTLLACVIGGTAGAVLTSRVDLGAAGKMTNIYSEPAESGEENEAAQPKIEKTGVTQFNTKYSLWAAGEARQEITEEAEAASVWLYLAAPAALWLFVLLLAVILVNRNLKIDPILLLGGKEE